ncbi:Sporulation initiation phosphotransferase F [Tepidimonas alkaliphilus]|uniref:Sporulation initiation phosphotransferase F n=1 Tax=Tepidimonas alkaliphilus TaxID=2588942 RepID=A0A554W917_9BURK|nr:response regulator [Tepidimonas alkaliphilus]TSE20074.1 Sporulation initiation phosphotransferase F [Tepidimonas alkaliphilus]
MANILVVDDELGIRELLFEILDDEGHSVELAENAAQARQARQRSQPDLVLLDIWMPDTDGVTLLKEWAATGQLTMPVIMMSGHATIETAVEATRIGAVGFLEKPITLQKLLQAVDKALSRAPLHMVAAAPAADSAAAPEAAAQTPAQGAAAPSAASAEPKEEAAALCGTVALPWPGRGTLMLDLDAPLREARDAFEKAYFEFHLAKEQGSMTRVAEKSGLERTHLYRKLKQLGVDLSRAKRLA